MKNILPLDYKQEHADLQRRGLDFILDARERDGEYEGNVPVTEFYNALFNNQQAYEAWASIEVHQYEDHTSIIRPYINDPKGRELIVNVTDEYFQSLNPEETKIRAALAEKKNNASKSSKADANIYHKYVLNEAQKKFKTREERRWDYGLWDAFFWNEFGIPLRLFSGTEYMLLTYSKVQDIDTKSFIRPHYNRKLSQLTDYLEILSGYTITEDIPGYPDRLSMSTAKCRASCFTTYNMGFACKGLMRYPKYDVFSHINEEGKIDEATNKFVDVYKFFPQWQKPLTSDTNLKTRGVTIRKVSVGGENSFKQTGAIPEKQQSLRGNFDFLDEIGKVEGYDITSLIENCRGITRGGGGVKTGFQSVGGTSSENVDGKLGQNMLNWSSVHMNALINNTVSFFMGRQHFMFNDPHTGWADEAKAIKIIQTRYINYKSIGDAAGNKSATMVLMEDPIKREHCFLTQNEVEIDLGKVEAQLEKCKQMGYVDMIQTGMFKENKLDMPTSYYRPTFVEMDDPMKYGWYILEHPSESVRQLLESEPGKVMPFFCAGSDNVNMKISPEKRKKLLNVGAKKARISMQAMVILDVMTCEPVAFYEQRHENPADDFIQMLLGCIYYGCLLSPEINMESNLEFFKDWQATDPRNPQEPPFKKGHFMRYIMPTPEIHRTGGHNFKGRHYGVRLEKMNMHLMIEEYYNKYISESPGSEYAQILDEKKPELLTGVSRCRMPKLLEYLLLTKIKTTKTGELTLEAPDLVMANNHALICRRAIYPLFAKRFKQVYGSGVEEIGGNPQQVRDGLTEQTPRTLQEQYAHKKRYW